MEHHAFARVDGERGAVEDGQAHAVLLVQDEGFTDVFDADHLGLFVVFCRMAATPYPAYK
ncbi:hypothetical protein [Escherichia coli]|uniref:hypothetical protein n=1 Tax=Escherichia coli TaxID=562 RepID=UPI0020767675|nr:hypothetical protein [Escherichia coli]